MFGLGWGIALLCILAAWAAIMWPFRSTRSLRDQHVFITGGSKGIGLCIAEECARLGARITIVARDKPQLEAAREKIQAAGEEVSTIALSADMSDFAQLEEAMTTAQVSHGPVDVLICNAGFSEPGSFVAMPMSNFERHISVNYMGCVRTIKAALPAMLERKSGHVVIVTSALAVLGFAGYSSYAPSKWALRGLADCLRNELLGTGVSCSVAYPPDTETPGYAHEEESKPVICRAVNAALGSELFPPQKVARAIVRGVLRRDYHIRGPDLGQNLLIDYTAGVAPGALPGLLSCLLQPVCWLVLAALRWRADAAAKRCNS